MTSVRVAVLKPSGERQELEASKPLLWPHHGAGRALPTPAARAALPGPRQQHWTRGQSPAAAGSAGKACLDRAERTALHRTAPGLHGTGPGGSAPPECPEHTRAGPHRPQNAPGARLPGGCSVLYRLTFTNSTRVCKRIERASLREAALFKEK